MIMAVENGRTGNTFTGATRSVPSLGKEMMASPHSKRIPDRGSVAYACLAVFRIMPNPHPDNQHDISCHD